MLISIQRDEDPTIRAILASLQGESGLKEIETGIYINCGFNFENSVKRGTFYSHEDGKEYYDRQLPGNENLNYDDPDYDEKNYLSNYGVVDSIEQWKQIYAAVVNHQDRQFAVGFTEVRKEDEEPGGWRWHKWGRYYGTKQPQYEYLYNEGPEITSVMTFSVVELKPTFSMFDSAKNLARSIRALRGK